MLTFTNGNPDFYTKKIPIYMSHVLVDWVLWTWKFECSTVCPTLLGLIGIWQKWLGSWASWWNTETKVNPTQPRSTRTWDARAL